MNIDRLEERLEHLARIGEGGEQADFEDGGRGVSRPAFSPADRRGRDQVAAWMRQAGLTVSEDAAGSVIGRLQTPTNRDRPSLVLGSHTDTVYNAGRYDGSLGVLAAIEVAAALQEQGESLLYPLEVVDFAMEESARFSLAMFGSRALAGRLDDINLEDYADGSGTTLPDALRKYGLSPDRVRQAQRPSSALQGYLELHIDQGRVLQHQEAAVGIVTGIAAPERFRLAVQGRATHSGGTLADQRRDALTGAAELILQAEAIMHEQKEAATVMTAGTLKVQPGVINTVPGRTVVGFDVRSDDLTSRDRAVASLARKAQEVEDARGLDVEWRPISKDYPAEMTSHIVERLARLAEEHDIDHRRIISLAAHDAMQMKSACPTGMVLVRNEGGVSHSPAEQVARDDLTQAAQLFYEASRYLLTH